ncbi:hypothetical protein EGT07_13535 [Herbaspirillum sp. HC18]|nr:hypothetical protein EGT07_13535 [Herbaspirillum sp. HC18]
MSEAKDLPDYFDDIVVGAGAAGAVIAARLSEDAGRRVLLIEAGPDFPPDQLPEELLNPNEPVTTGYHWKIPVRIRETSVLGAIAATGATLLGTRGMDQMRMVRSSIQGGINSAVSSMASFNYNVGKIVGGSTAINGALAIRGTPDDYDEWAPFSDRHWNRSRVESAFQALEAVEGEASASDGRVPIHQEGLQNLTPIQAAFFRACNAAGFPVLEPDAPRPARGISLVRKAMKAGQRMSSARTHLAGARARPNLTILASAHVDRLLWAGETICQGVEAIANGRRCSILAARVVLSAGVLNTPAILMRSGVGPPDVLKRAHVPVRIALAGVGANLSDHAAVGLWAVPKAGISSTNEPTHQAFLRLEGANRNDLHLYMLGGVRTDIFPMLRSALGSPIGIALAPCVMKPRSRGACRILSADPMAPPDVTINCLVDPEDMRVMKEGVRHAWEILQMPSLNRCIERVLTWNPGMIGRDSTLECAIATFVRPGWHAVGTARMGLERDPLAVVNAEGRVHGVSNLWIADASIMPTIPSAPTGLTCMMLGEEIAHALRKL